MTPDNVCGRYGNKSVGLSLRLIEQDDGSAPDTVLIEGPPKALRMLAELLVAVAEDPESDGFSISPFGAGSFHFSRSSRLGVYINPLRD